MMVEALTRFFGKPDKHEQLRKYGSMSLEELLEALTAYGSPRVSRMRNGWYAGIEMHVSSAGADFKINSGFDMDTPLAAVQQCTQRVLETLGKYS